MSINSVGGSQQAQAHVAAAQAKPAPAAEEKRAEAPKKVEAPSAAQTAQQDAASGKRGQIDYSV